MDDQEKNKPAGEISRLLQEKAKKGFEFGKSSANLNQKDIGKPENTQTGIDRGRWAD